MKKSEAIRIFKEELEKFSRLFDVKSTPLIFETRHFSKDYCDRDYAWAKVLDSRDGKRISSIHLLERTLALPEDNLRAIVRHELGHCCDDFISMKGAEQRADDIALLVAGDLISYDSRLVQTIGNGNYPRPDRLRS